MLIFLWTMLMFTNIQPIKISLHHKAAIIRCCEEINREISPNVVYVSISESRLYHYNNWNLVKSYIISYSKRPLSQIKDSYGTPLGLHEIIEKYGDALPPGTILKGRVSTNRTYEELAKDEQKKWRVATRILRLAGLQPGFNRGGNCDTYERYIYIHGTPDDEKIGERISQGCICMRTQDIIELYDILPVGSLVMVARD
jgi:lipoprotein-anchoring transpeptidase ErfK/SrfK